MNDDTIKKGLYVSVLLFVILSIYQLMSGLTLTGLSDEVPWGLYVVNFAFLFGTGTGLVVISNYYAIIDKFNRKTLFISNAAASLMFIIGAASIVLDLGSPFTVIYMVLTPQITSTIFYDTVACLLLVGISLSYGYVLYLMMNNSKSKIAKKIDDILTKNYAHYFVIVSMLVLYMITTELFSGLKGMVLWHTPLMNIFFILSALTGGMAVFAQVGYRFEQKKDVLKFNKNVKRDFFLLIVFHFAAYALMNSREFTFVPDVVVLAFHVFPLGLLFLDGIYSNLIAPNLVLLGLFLARAEIIVTGYYNVNVPVTQGVSYMPTLYELVVLGLMYVIMGLFLVCVYNYLNKGKLRA